MSSFKLKKSGRIFALIGLSLIIIYLSIIIALNTGVEIEKIGQLGDTLGGISSPLIGFAAVLATFLAFWIQFEANEDQRDALKKQQSDLLRQKKKDELDRFETKFYELLRLHKENIAEIDIAGRYIGRKAFVQMYLEYRFLYFIILNSIDQWNNNAQDYCVFYNLHEKAELAFIIFFFGVGELSDKGTDYYTGKYDKVFINRLLSRLKYYQDIFEKYSSLKYMKRPNIKVLNIKYEKSVYEWEPNYYPFDGHVSKLGHYYRHLYQIIKFIVEKHPDVEPTIDGDLFLTKENEVVIYSYIKTLRAQISNHEQALIYFNSFFVAGTVWWEEKPDRNIKVLCSDGEVISYFLDFGIIKNLPFNLTDGIGPDPQKLFKHQLSQRKPYYIKDISSDFEAISNRMNELFEWVGG